LSLPPQHGCLNRLLHESEAAIIRGTDRIGGADIIQRARILADGLQLFRGSRVAVVSPHPEQIVIALAAAELAGCSIVLHRSGELPEQLADRWAVSAVVDASLEIGVRSRGCVEAFNPCVCIPTSGTTGEPKLVQQTMAALLGRIRRQPSEARMRWLLTYHPATFGGLQVILTALHDATDLIVVSQPSIRLLRDAALFHAVTHISGTPTFWRAFLMALGDRTCELKLKQITLGGEIADESILRTLRTKFPHTPIRHIYASTEAGSLFSVRDGRPGFPADWLETGADGVGLRVMDGVLQVRSPRVMLGYATPGESVVTDDGWLITGDQVELVGDRVYFRGRQDSILNIGGAKVRPEEVEDAILRLKGIADAYVYGVPNPLTGMVIAADIVLAPGESAGDLRQAITSQLRTSLESYKIPRLIKFVESITLTPAGKKQKSK